jgi:dienelactone hydrolase
VCDTAVENCQDSTRHASDSIDRCFAGASAATKGRSMQKPDRKFRSSGATATFFASFVVALCVAFATIAHGQTVAPPLSPRGPHPVGCTNVEQDLTRVPPGETAGFYWRGLSIGGVERYVTSLLVDPSNALIATFVAPGDASLYSRWSGRTLTYAVLVCYPTTGDNPYASYSLSQSIVVPHMQRGGQPPVLPPTPARLPVLLFSHGYGGSPLQTSYLNALVAFASWGYVVVAPFHGDFRYSIFGPDNGGNEAVYVPIWDEFVAMQATRALSLSAALDALADHPHWRDRIDMARIGAFGISQGGETTMLAAGAGLTYRLGSHEAKRVTLDSRIRAGVGYVPYFGIDSLPAFGDQQYGVDAVTLPYLALSGANDSIAPIDVTRTALDRLPGIRGQVALSGQGHDLDATTSDDIFTWSLTFLAAWLLDDTAARARLEQMQSVQGGLDDQKVLYSLGAPSYQGLWWNEAESGWGLNFAHQGNLLYLTWYTFDSSGKASWLAMLASRIAGETFAGDIIEVHGSPYTASPYDPTKKTVATVGSGTLAFSSRDEGTFSYTAKGVPRTVAITRFPLGGTTPACTYYPAPDLTGATNVQDLWWGGAPEDGWGLNIADERTIAYATWYTFDVDGSPLWLSALMTPSSPGHYAGTLQRVSGPPFGPTFDPSQVSVVDVGTAEVDVTNGNSIAWKYSVGTTGANKPLTRIVFSPPAGTVCR